MYCNTFSGRIPPRLIREEEFDDDLFVTPTAISPIEGKTLGVSGSESISSEDLLKVRAAAN